MNSDQQRLDLVRRYVDGTATAEETQALENALRTDAAFRHQFLRYTNVDAALGNGLLSGVAVSLPAPMNQLPARWPSRRPVIAQSVERVVAETVDAPVRGKIVRMPVNSRARWTLAAAALVAAAVVVAVWPAREAGQNRVALSGQDGAAKQLGPAPLVIDSGTAELDFANGTRVTVYGPARVESLGPAEARLVSGRLTASVPAAARGFAVDTAAGRVVDLGTRFGMATGAAESVEVQVFEGRVEVTTRQQERIQLAAGEAAVLDPARGVVARATADEAKFSADTARPVSDRRARFTELYAALHDPANGYFSRDGIPYHSRETLLCEAPDYGHLTTSETFSYWLQLEAMQGRVTGDWGKLSAAWDTMERVMIPAHDEQPTSGYKAGKPSSYAAEWEEPQKYPAKIEGGLPVGRDPLFAELQNTYGTSDLYGMHWLLDVDNWYGYGRRGKAGTSAGFINTFQRGPEESVWETVPHPSWENFAAGGRNGFLDLFATNDSYAKQWRYTNAPDADARAVQAIFWAKTWADEKGGAPEIEALAAKAARMGDSLRYALFDKHFRKIGSPAEPGSGRTAAHHLLGWYYAWGGSMETKGGWAFRIGGSHAHAGYQNPLAAFALSKTPALTPKSPSAGRDWKTSLARQLEFYRWLQSAEGAIAGGATNSWNGRYEEPPADAATFYGMVYEAHPVYRDPGSNSWFGLQAWSVQRVAELYYATGNPAAKQVLDRWIAWVLASVQLPPDGSFAVPSTLEWSGQPDTWNAAAPGANSALHVTVRSHSQDVGIAASVARSLLYYSAGEKRWAGKPHALAKATAETLLDRMWTLGRDAHGVALPERRGDYRRFFEEKVHVPNGWTGKLPTGAEVKSGATFLSLRPQYRKDPAFPALEQAWTQWDRGGRKGEFVSPEYRYHRFWAQVEVALANAEHEMLFSQE